MKPVYQIPPPPPWYPDPPPRSPDRPVTVRFAAWSCRIIWAVWGLLVGLWFGYMLGSRP